MSSPRFRRSLRRIAGCFVLSLLVPAALAAQSAFSEQEVVIPRTDGQGRQFQLAGTLSVPENASGAVSAANTIHPAVILITGSGSQNRDEELMGHKPFKVLADYLARKGYVVLRCDDRGVGGSTGAFPDATTVDLADDIEALFLYLRRHPAVDPSQIVLVGHSEGGLIAPMVAARQRQVAAVVLLAGPGLSGTQTLLEQNETIFRLRGVPDSLIRRRIAYMEEVFEAADSVAAWSKAAPDDTVPLVKRLNRCFKPILKRHNQGLTAEQKQQVGLTTAECYGWAATMAVPWMQTFCTLEPADYLSQLQCPVLALGGSLDCQVNAVTNLSAIERVCHYSGVECKTVILMKMNHLFQQCETGAVEEYASLGQSPDDKVLQTLADWLSETLSPRSRR